MTKPIINHDPGCLPRSIDETIDALANSNVGLVRWADSLYQIRVLSEAQNGVVSRPKGSIVLVPATQQLIMELGTGVAVHRKYDARLSGDDKYKIINCPAPVSAGIIARGFYPEFPLLNGVVEAATLDRDGREISNPGLDPKTGLYIATDKPLPAMNGVMGRAKALKAIQMLKAPLRGFSFVSDADMSAALAAIMTALIRRILPSAPMFGITAPTPGTGKTLLAEVVAIIATGRRPPVMSMGSDENELAKRLNGVLLSGDSMLLIDNVTRAFGNEDVINQILSQPVMRFRPLGGSGMVSAPTNLIVMVTANNLVIIGDAKRRTVLIQMDARDERPDTREFNWDVLVETSQQREQLIRAALEITKAYFEAGKPRVDGWKPFGSFNDWDEMVRRPLMFFGEPDPIASADVLRVIDPDAGAMRLMFSQIFALQDEWIRDALTASEIISKGNAKRDDEYIRPDLHEALELTCGGRIDSRRLGNWLRVHANRIVTVDCSKGDSKTITLQLERAGHDNGSNVAKWRVVER